MDKFIVAEVSKNWTMQTAVADILSQRFEMVINANAARGYKLLDYRGFSVVNGDTMTETIIAVFERVEGSRRVNFEFYDTVEKKWLKGQGLFHQWGQSYEEFTNGAVQFTYALVESDAGFMHEVHPSKLQFINPQ